MAKILGRSFFFAVCLAFACPAMAADPLLMFIFGVAKEVASASGREPAPAPAAAVSITYPGTTVTPPGLRRLIDESFTYLSERQRTEVFDALNGELMKPGNVAVNAPLIEHFAERALQVRAAQQALAKLTGLDKQRLAAEFRSEVKTLGDEDVGQLRTVLERGLLPLPSDLNQLLLAALD